MKRTAMEMSAYRQAARVRCKHVGLMPVAFLRSEMRWCQRNGATVKFYPPQNEYIHYWGFTPPTSP